MAASHDQSALPEQGRCSQDYYCYSEVELATAESLILLSLSRGGYCVSSSSAAADSASHVISGEVGNDATETTISGDEKTQLLLRMNFGSKAKPSAYKCDICGREFASPQAVGGHKTSHRPKTKTALPDLNVPLTVFES